MLETIQLLLGQLSVAYLGDLLVTAVFLMGLNGIILGIIAWSLTDKHGDALMLMMVGGGFGLLIGLLVEGGQIFLQFGSLELIYENVGRISNQVFEVFLGVLSWTLAGMAVGGLLSSITRALTGAALGFVAGTLAAIILLLARQEFNLNINDTLLTIGTIFVTMGLLVIMGYGQAQRD